jgi:predicted nucleic acid-binding protein
MTTGARAFVDTNVLLRSLHPSIALYAEADALVVKARQDGYELWVSRQIIREYIVQATRPGVFDVPLNAKEVTEKVQAIRSTFRVADETDAVTDQLLELLNDFPSGGKQIHDANIVATMLVYDISTLLTQNVHDMKRFSTKITIIPLAQERS